jgi:hypothetical protein
MIRKTCLDKLAHSHKGLWRSAQGQFSQESANSSEGGISKELREFSDEIVYFNDLSGRTTNITPNLFQIKLRNSSPTQVSPNAMGEERGFLNLRKLSFKFAARRRGCKPIRHPVREDHL